MSRDTNSRRLGDVRRTPVSNTNPEVGRLQGRRLRPYWKPAWSTLFHFFTDDAPARGVLPAQHRRHRGYSPAPDSPSAGGRAAPRFSFSRRLGLPPRPRCPPVSWWASCRTPPRARSRGWCCWHATIIRSPPRPWRDPGRTDRPGDSPGTPRSRSPRRAARCRPDRRSTDHPLRRRGSFASILLVTAKAGDVVLWRRCDHRFQRRVTSGRRSRPVCDGPSFRTPPIRPYCPSIGGRLLLEAPAHALGSAARPAAIRRRCGCSRIASAPHGIQPRRPAFEPSGLDPHRLRLPHCPRLVIMAGGEPLTGDILCASMSVTRLGKARAGPTNTAHAPLD